MTSLARRERFARVRTAFEEVVDLDLGERERHLAELSVADPELAREIESLLAAASSAPAFLERSADALALEGRVVGAWRIEERIASGGMGDVYRASRVGDDLAWRVAVKVLRTGFDGVALLARFRDERRTLAKLNHPNIVSLLDVGTLDDGRPYFAMELVEGEAIDRHCAAAGLDLVARIELFLTVCSAVACAHRSLVAHCDLKPANVLVTRDGHVKLLDFGIAELLHAAGTPRALPITPGYASPEQARGDPITIASDVWSLGVVLSELVAGARVHPPASPARGNAADLDAIVRRCVATLPADRYTSVGELAADLEAWLAGEPVRARPLSSRERWTRALSRHRWSALAASVAVLSLALATVLSLREAARVRGEARLGWRAHAEAVQVTRLLEELLRDARRAAPDGASLEPALDAASSRAVQSFASSPETLGRLHIAFGALYLDLGRPDKARAELEAALALVRAHRGFGREDVERAEALLARASGATPPRSRD